MEGKRRGWLIALGLGNTVLWALGIASTNYRGLDIGVTGFAGCVAAAALWTFLLFLRDAGDVRTAVTACFVALYLGFVIGSMVPSVSGDFKTDGSFVHAVWSQLNALMLAIIGFYFGGKAWEEVTARRHGRRTELDRGTPDQSEETPPEQPRS